MSPRHKRLRKVITPPVIKGYKPYGPDISQAHTEPVILLFEEYEALKLCDYDMYNHEQASRAMHVSRPTFTRVYATARQKIAKAFVEGRPISIEGGKVYFDSDWYHCQSCHCYFNNPEMDKKIEACPLCGSDSFANYILESQENTSQPCHEEKEGCGKGHRKRKGKMQD
jgi:predicted DNA-binding protein (UPF0251 family)